MRLDLRIIGETQSGEWSALFEAIAIRRSTDVDSLGGADLGSLAEAILFYGQTNFLIGRGTMRALLHTCGAETTVRLVEEGYVRARYMYWDAGVYTENSGTARASYLPTVFTVGKNFEQEIRDLWEEELGRSGRLRRLRNRFVAAAPLLEQPTDLAGVMRGVLADEHFLEDGARTVITHLAPSYRLPTGFYFRAEPLANNRIKILSNLDTAAATRAHQSYRGSDAGTLDAAMILAELTDAQVDLHIAAEIGCDTLASDMSSKLFSSLTSDSLRATTEQQNLVSLSEIAFEGGSIRGAINSGARTLDEYFPILDASLQFRDWLREVPADASLAKAYFDECTKKTWVSSLPVRVIRWALVLLASLHVPVAGGAAIAAFDSLILDRVAEGWRPNQFIDRQLGPFVA